MRAIACRELTGPIALRVENRESLEPTDGEVKIAAHAWGVNFVDVLMTRGGYQLKPELAFLCGLEDAGEVLDVGRTVTEYRPGDRAIYGMRPGAFAEVITVASTSIIHAEATLDWEQAACFRSAYVTAYHGLVQSGRLAAGEVALIHDATGGMGLAAVQVAKLLGATVIATGSSESKLDIVKNYGADHVVSYASPHFRETVRDLSGGADVIFDPVGGDVFDESMRCLNWSRVGGCRGLCAKRSKPLFAADGSSMGSCAWSSRVAGTSIWLLTIAKVAVLSPSCASRRMAETGAKLVDEVLPTVPYRQWVLSFPIPLRLLFARSPEVLIEPCWR